MDYLLDALDKLVDINLDVLTTSYQEGEQAKLIKDVAFLRECNSNSTVIPYAQPIFNAKTLKVEKYECLMRLRDPSDSTIIKSIFPYLETAKNIKIYPSLMRTMLKKSFDYFSNTDHTFSINLGYEDITNSAFADEIFSYISKCKNPHQVVFEIVETDFIRDFSIIKSFVTKARSYGSIIAVDDFGSGFSSLQNILSLKPEIIKIDGSLIEDLDTSKDSEIIVKNIINMTKDLGSKTVAEFIHSSSVMEKAQELGVDFLQGFYLGKPAPLKNID
ncbi:MAG: EAL domain-containing protein [Campylobacteraceae bacterium]|nr:EAL domain-containing protein [Campylobacteraceae bacterium]